MFKLFGPGDTACSTPIATYNSSSGGNTYGTGNYFTNTAGIYRWVVSYPGDANNEPAGTGCGDAGSTVTMTKDSPTLNGTASGGVSSGFTITDEATLFGGGGPSPGPTGTVTFQLSGRVTRAAR